MTRGYDVAISCRFLERCRKWERQLRTIPSKAKERGSWNRQTSELQCYVPNFWKRTFCTSL